MSDKLNVVRRDIAVSDTNEPGATVSHSYCEWHMDRINRLAAEAGSNWMSAMWSFASVAAAAGLALIVLTPEDQAKLPGSSVTILWAVVIGGAALAVTCAMGHFSTRRSRMEAARAIVMEFAMHAQVEPSDPPLRGLKGYRARRAARKEARRP
jgi:hypothetical protein